MLDQLSDLVPVQVDQRKISAFRVPRAIHLAAYEVYAEVFGPQEALVSGDCRGGFGLGEILCLLHARSFPRHEWRNRVREARAQMDAARTGRDA